MRFPTAPHSCRGGLKRRSWKQRLPNRRPVWSVPLILRFTIVSGCRSRFMSQQNVFSLDRKFALVYPFEVYNSIEKSVVDCE